MNIPIIFQIIALLIAVIIHEVSHGWIADKLGDPTARLMGRITLNPIPHLDLFGSILLPLLLIFINSPFLIGWAKPVPFDPYNLKDPRKDSAKIAIAGPISNILMAIIGSVALRLMFAFSYGNLLATQFLVAFIGINIILALFNLLPIHPLDGGKIFIALLPKSEASEADAFLRKYGIIILLLLIYPFGGRSPISYIFSPIISFSMSLLLPNLSVF